MEINNYINLSLESEPKIIGVNNGIYQCEILPKKFKNKIQFSKLEKITESYSFKSEVMRTIENNVKIEYCELLKKAKITDIISFSPYLSPCQFIISEKLYHILVSYKLGEWTSFIPVSMHEKNGKKLEGNFYMFFQDSLPFSHINFSKSIYFTINPKEYHKINNLNEYRETLFLDCEKLVLNSNFNNELDFFSIRGMNGYGISRKLLKKLEEENISGFNIRKKIKIENNVSG